jgi:hypothetical protein
MKRVVPVAVGLAAGMAVGFFLGAMVTRHDEPMIVIHNATDETLRGVSIQTDFHPTFIRRVPTVETYGFNELQPDETIIDRMLWRGPMMLTVRATRADGKELPSQKVYVAPRGVLFAWVSSDGITLQYSPQLTINDTRLTARRDQ